MSCLSILDSPSVLILVIVVWVLLISPLVTVMVIMTGHIVGVMHLRIVNIVLVVSVPLSVVDASNVLGNSPKSSHSLTINRGSVISFPSLVAKILIVCEQKLISFLWVPS